MAMKPEAALHRTERHGPVEIRFNSDGTLDELVLYDAQGKCVTHLEQMDNCGWFLSVGGYPGLQVAAWLRSTRVIKAHWEKR